MSNEEVQQIYNYVKNNTSFYMFIKNDNYLWRGKCPLYLSDLLKLKNDNIDSTPILSCLISTFNINFKDKYLLLVYLENLILYILNNNINSISNINDNYHINNNYIYEAYNSLYIQKIINHGIIIMDEDIDYSLKYNTDEKFNIEILISKIINFNETMKDIIIKNIKYNTLYINKIPNIDIKLVKYKNIYEKNKKINSSFEKEYNEKKLQILNETYTKYYNYDLVKLTQYYTDIISIKGELLEYVDNHIKTETMCIIAVKNNGLSLQFVPQEFKTRELCEYAVNNNNYALEFVPYQLIDNNLCLELVKKNIDLIKIIPNEIRTVELWYIAIKNKYNQLIHVPPHMRTFEICLEAVKNFENQIFFVPNDVINYDIFYEVFIHDPNFLNRQLKEKYYKLFIYNSYNDFDFNRIKIYKIIYDKKKFDNNLVKEILSIKNISNDFDFKINKFKSKKICLDIVNKYDLMIEFVHEKHIDICLKSINSNFIEIVKKNGLMLEFIPDIFKTPELYMEAIKQNIDAIKYFQIK
jgi:ABC-type multidrug transport system permease subunit